MTAPIISVRIDGTEAVVKRLAFEAPQNAQNRVRLAVRGLGLSLQRNIVTTWLAGRALNKRTGRGQRSVNTNFTESGGVFTSRTGTSLVYLRAWELGFSTPAYDIRPKLKQALYWPGAKHPVKVVHRDAADHPARPWLRPALLEMKPQIQKTIAQAIRGI